MTAAAPAPPLILVHAGFHKTGTSTLQACLHANRALLAPHLRLILRADMVPVARAARALAQGRWALPRRLRLRRALARLLDGVDPADPRPLLISYEGLSGTVPGFGRVRGYDRAPMMAAEVRRALIHRFGPDAPIAFLYTTRAADAWRRSAYAHLVQYQRVTQDFTGFRAGLAPGAPDFDGTLAAIGRAVAPAPVHGAALEDLMRRPLGPAEAVLDLLDLPEALRATLSPMPPQNRGTDQGTIARHLELNRTIADRQALRRAKNHPLTRAT